MSINLSTSHQLIPFQKRLLVFRNTVIMSLEECYKTFLTEDSNREQDKVTLAEYLVYASMTRNQFNTRVHKESPFKDKKGQEVDPVEDDEELIWSNLLDLLSNQKQKPTTITTQKRKCIVNLMEQNKEFIASQSSIDQAFVSMDESSESDFSWPKAGTKRKHSSAWETAPKRSKVVCQDNGVDKLMSDPEYQDMRSVFEELQVIRVNPQIIEDGFKSEFKFCFDFLKNDNKKKGMSLLYRGIVCTKDKGPTYKDLVHLQRQQASHLPILVFHVDKSMILSCFIYDVEM